MPIGEIEQLKILKAEVSTDITLSGKDNPEPRLQKFQIRELFCDRALGDSFSPLSAIIPGSFNTERQLMLLSTTWTMSPCHASVGHILSVTEPHSCCWFYYSISYISFTSLGGLKFWYYDYLWNCYWFIDEYACV